MKAINKSDVLELNNVILELPAFVNSTSKEGLSTILNSTLEDIYIDTPSEFMEYMRYNLNERLTETILAIYGIDKEYSKKVNIASKESWSSTLRGYFKQKVPVKYLVLLQTSLETSSKILTFIIL